ncbi:MAG: ABC transporter ATP-binding protein [Actinomycetota bacterium]
MISFRNVSLIYPNSQTTVFEDVTFEVGEGEFILLIGSTGIGKSSALKLMNGLVPHHTGGILSGDIQVDGISTRGVRPGELSHLIGIVGQNPIHGFVTDIVEEEIAFAMESLAIPESAMRKRVEVVLDLLALSPMRSRTIATLSGGEQLRVAIASALVMNPKILLLDEPTSALDPVAADEVLAILQRIVHDLGVTVVIAEHRLERVIHYADRIIHISRDGSVLVGSPSDVMKDAEIAPPIVELARSLGVDEIPLSVRDARRVLAPETGRLASVGNEPLESRSQTGDRRTIVKIRNAELGYAEKTVLSGISLEIGTGEIVALMGRNGAGKSTLMRALSGVTPPLRGEVSIEGSDPSTFTPEELVRIIGFVPQNPSDLLYGRSVGEECELADKDQGLPAGSTLNTLESLLPGISEKTHPRDLSEGQRLTLVLAIVLATDPHILILDEPTRGLDYPSKERLIAILKSRATRERSILIATHDVELVAELADRVLFIADGELVSDGNVREVLTASLPFAPQVAKILAPQKWLTVKEVIDALGKS